MQTLFNFFALIVGSILIGIGTSSWLVGFGVFIIGFGWHVMFVATATDLYNSITRNMRQIYNKLPDN